jgi:hypothetical protein
LNRGRRDSGIDLNLELPGAILNFKGLIVIRAAPDVWASRDIEPFVSGDEHNAYGQWCWYGRWCWPIATPALYGGMPERELASMTEARGAAHDGDQPLEQSEAIFEAIVACENRKIGPILAGTKSLR